MSKRQQIFLLCGCAFVFALEMPRAVQQVQVDLAGPYSLPAHAASSSERLARTGKDAASVHEALPATVHTTVHTGVTPIPVLVEEASTPAHPARAAALLAGE